MLGWLARLSERGLREVVRLGEETAVYRVVEVPWFGYDRAAHGSFANVFDAGVPGREPLDLFQATCRVTSRVAYADPGGRLVEDDVTNIGAVLAAAPHAGPHTGRNPLDLSAFPALDSAQEIDLMIESYSDVWLPWCSAQYEQGAHLDDLADNRELARRHTPRLNEFLAGVAESAERTGGALEISPDNTSPEFGFQLHDHGVRLDVDNPLERSVYQRFGGRDDPDLLGALRRAAEKVRRTPPPAPYRAAVCAWTDHVGRQLYEADRVAVLAALRRPDTASAPLSRDELAGISTVWVQIYRRRHRFAVDELTG
ncbi:hypothetical protein [Plantactinospora sp. KLBMP9567]|uniref:hypothetical protein n=1 Tax=Plantactinospora sp. KLBMP9567 TaxID=3085900 RepID=UPI0029810D8F|nr:hypothetical protein [Plantactinospora sp. KLBMP9567]MDW5329637.1 hypothetical protein [Plantactinospora sp. KLBMP9567]